MSRVARTLQDPSNPFPLAEFLSRLQRIVDGDLGFGSPQDPRDPTSTTLADGVSHNGTLENIQGAWVEMSITAADTLTLFPHNLAVPLTIVAAVNQPNVRWGVLGIKHNGTGVNAASTLSLDYDTRDAASITPDSFPLRLYVGGGRTVNGGNPVLATIFFLPAVR